MFLRIEGFFICMIHTLCFLLSFNIDGLLLDNKVIQNKFLIFFVCEETLEISDHDTKVCILIFSNISVSIFRL